MEQPRATIHISDVVMAALMLLGGLLATVPLREILREVGPMAPWAVPPGWPATIALLAVTMGPVATRRRFPLSGLVVTTGGLAAARLYHVPETTVTTVAFILVLYAAGRWGRAPARTWVRAVCSVALIGVVLLGLAEGRQDYVDEVSLRVYYLAALTDLVANVGFLAAIWWLGNVARIRADRERELTIRSLELEVEREERARQAVVTERLRIAREIHDVVAHHVSVMGIQAGAARRVAKTSPSGVDAPLLAIESSSREAVAELQRLLLFLRSDETPAAPAGEDADRSPLPGLDQLPQLRRQLADAGLACRYEVSGQERSLPPAVNLSAYRIIQESLTNVLKHGGVDQAHLHLDYGVEALTVTVTNEVRFPAPPSRNGNHGNGIRGMRERAVLVGGRFSAQLVEKDRFLVEAVLPYHARIDS
jgi:signal transduction histidine kinase